MVKKIRIPPKDKLEYAYLVELKSSTSIGRDYGCSYWTVLKWLNQYDIPIHKRVTFPDLMQRLPKVDLVRLYKVEDRSSHDIGVMYGVSSPIILKLLREYAIPIRKPGIHTGATPLKEQTCNILKDHAEDLKDDPERLSTEFLKKLIGVECDINKHHEPQPGEI